MLSVQKTAKTKEELYSIIEQLDSENYVSYQIEKSVGSYNVTASKENQNQNDNSSNLYSLEKAESLIKAYVKKKNDYGIGFVLEREEEDNNFIPFEITMRGNFNLPWGKHYRVGSIDCYLAESKTDVEEYRLSLYTDLIPKEKLKNLAKSHKLLEAWNVGNLYSVYSFGFDDLETVFAVIDSIAYPKP